MDAVTTGTHSRIEQIGPERARTPALVGAVWALLVINTIGSSGTGALIRLPTTVFQLITMGALGAAFLLALVLNPRIRLRRNVFLLVATVLAAEGIFTSVSPPTTLGSVFRCARLAVFVLTLWLLSCWWEDSLRFVLHHIRALGVLLGTVLVGLAVAPGHALPAAYGGRLVGALWYFPPPRVAEYAAVVSGLAVVLWLGRQVSGRSTLVVAGPAVAMVLLTHTRTATIGLVAALAAAILTLLLCNSRAFSEIKWSVLS
ncbi:MAG: O-antigen ligase domain-containing protein, partial [Sciscionella sp.]